MKKQWTGLAIALMILVRGAAIAQEQEVKSWAFDIEANSYFFKGGDYIFLPVFKANKDWLHTEVRYNYEDLKTVSVWAGYSFRGGEKTEYVITPMVGGLTGQTKGVAAGLEFSLTFGKFEIYSEGEYVWDTAGQEYNFFYNWSDITYALKDWWWVGFSGQRTRLYKTDLEYQRGFLMGASLKQWAFTGYLYNLGFGEPFFLFTIGVEF